MRHGALCLVPPRITGMGGVEEGDGAGVHVLHVCGGTHVHRAAAVVVGEVLVTCCAVE